MADWRDQILQHLTKCSYRLIVVADPDHLLLEECLLMAIRARGFALLPFQDAIAFRYAFESAYRQKWDNLLESRLQDAPRVIVALHLPQTSLQSLPYDILKNGYCLHFSLAQLFPKVSYPVVSKLDLSYLQPLYEAHQEYHGEEMGDRASKRFVLRHVFGVMPELIKTPADLLKLLLERHVRGLVVPAHLDDLLVEQLCHNCRFDGWPLEELLTDAVCFFAFLQAGWQQFLTSLQPTVPASVQPAAAAIDQPVKEVKTDYVVKEPLPFDDPDIRVYLDNLFLEGKMKPIPVPAGWQVTGWARVGIRAPGKADDAEFFSRLLERVSAQLPTESAGHREWLQFADRWAEVVTTRYRQTGALEESVLMHYQSLHLDIEKRFAKWMLAHYHALHNQPFLPQPVMLHHIPAYMATYWQLRPGVRLALVVVDGLSLDLWHIVRSVLDQSWSIREGSLFTWVPTLTAISRQALFAGCPPQFFPNSWNTTDQEPVRWRRFWAEHDLPATAIGYARNLGNADLTIGLTNLSDGPASSGQYENAARLEPALLELIEDDRVQVVGLVVNTVDDISHGMQLGTAGLHQQVQLWMTQRPYLTTLVGHLLQGRFTVFVTADHGHIWARGVGRPQEGVLVETRGQRARIYDSTTFLNLARTQIPEAIEWDNTGLPESLKVLLAPGLSAFLDPGEQAVCHGGIALEEVIVPFVQVIGHE